MKRIFAYILCFSFLFQAFLLSVNADTITTEEMDLTVTISAEIETAITKALGGIAPEKEYYGLANTAMDNLKIGSRIPAYVTTDVGTIVEFDEIEFYPIFDGQRNLKTMALVVCDEVEGTWACITSEWVDILKDYINVESIAVLYDKDGVYLLKASGVVLMQNNDIAGGVIGRTAIADVTASQFAVIETKMSRSVCSVDYEGQIEPMVFGSYSKYITVDIITQPSGSGWCWAACMASMVNHEKNKNYDCEDVANFFTTNVNQGATVDEVKSRFSSKFGLNYSKLYTETGQVMTNVVDSMRNNHPIYGAFNSQNDMIRHAMVIRGINFGTDTISLMDPALSSGYKSGSIVSVTETMYKFTTATSSYGGVSRMMYCLYL